MNWAALLKLLQNPQMLAVFRPILLLVVKQLAAELNKPEVQEQLVDALIEAAKQV